MNGPNTKTGVEREILKVYTVEEKHSTDGALNKGVWGIFPQKILNLLSLKCHFLRFCKALIFQEINMKENASGAGRGTFLFFTTL